MTPNRLYCVASLGCSLVSRDAGLNPPRPAQPAAPVPNGGGPAGRTCLRLGGTGAGMAYNLPNETICQQARQGGEFLHWRTAMDERLRGERPSRLVGFVDGHGDGEMVREAVGVHWLAHPAEGHGSGIGPAAHHPRELDNRN
jgi:hypothetical protein